LTRSKKVERVLGLITEGQFFQLLSLSKKIMDWAGNGDKDISIDLDMKRKDVKIENEVGVTIVYDKEEEDAEGYQVREKCSGNNDDGNNDDIHKTNANTPVRMDR